MFFINGYLYSKLIVSSNYVNIVHILSLGLGILFNWYFNSRLKHSNVLLVTKVQKICRTFKFDDIFFRRFGFHNWICVISINIFFMTLISYYVWLAGVRKVLNIFTVYSVASFDVNILYGMSVIKFSCVSIKHWIKEVQEFGYSEEWVPNGCLG